MMALEAMSLIRGSILSSTAVIFPYRKLESTSKILDVARISMKNAALFLEETSFHPVDMNWPDQPADKGVLLIGEKELNVVDCKIFGVHKENKSIIEAREIPRGEKANWYYTVGHIVEIKEEDPGFFLDKEVVAKVDSVFRFQLSLHHTCCHLAAFALNFVTKEFWSKDLNASNRDTLGSPNFDQLAMDRSLIFPDHSEDIYRFGKSIKKKGLQTEEIMLNLEHIQERVNMLLDEWLKTKSKVDILCEGPYLDSRRVWRCELIQGIAELPCGGTHISDLSIIKQIKYSLKIISDESTKEKKLMAITEALPNI